MVVAMVLDVRVKDHLSWRLNAPGCFSVKELMSLMCSLGMGDDGVKECLVWEIEIPPKMSWIISCLLVQGSEQYGVCFSNGDILRSHGRSLWCSSFIKCYTAQNERIFRENILSIEEIFLLIKLQPLYWVKASKRAEGSLSHSGGRAIRGVMRV
ncbi:hypothetical protein V6N13_018925 [Hibiscus sabdariffa]